MYLDLKGSVQRAYLLEQDKTESPGDWSITTHGHQSTSLHPWDKVIHLSTLVPVLVAPRGRGTTSTPTTSSSPSPS